MRRAFLKSSLAVAFGGFLALPLAFAGAEKRNGRADCPGKVTCPLTGEEVCKDQCPVSTAATDQTASAVDASDDLPPCCRKAKK